MTSTGGAFDAAFAVAFRFGGTTITWLELVAFVLAVLTVVFNMRIDVRAWPLAIASSLLYFALFWHARLYGDASLQILFVVVSIWGWRAWLAGRSAPAGTPVVRSLGGRRRIGVLLALAIGWPATGLFLKHATDTDVPWWDAFPTALSVIGTWLLGRKYIENWPVWIVVNVASVGLFAYKALWLTVLLYTIFIGLAIAGWRAWHRLAATRPGASEAR